MRSTAARLRALESPKIWAVRKTGEAQCFQCANHRALKFKKAEEDLAKLVAGPNGPPMRFTLIAGGKVGARRARAVW